jgi:hypothetical protein
VKVVRLTSPELSYESMGYIMHLQDGDITLPR